MPIYEYECEICGAIEEVLQKFSDKPLKTCRHCSGKLSKIVSQSSFHLKGTGWYVTDYAGKKRQTAASPPPAKKDAGSSGTDAKTQTSESSKTP